MYLFHQVPCDDCPLQYEPIKDDQLYKVINNMIFFSDNHSHHDANLKFALWLQVVMTEYVAGGGDGFKIIAENKEKHLQVRILNMIYEFRKCHFAGENWYIYY